MGEEVYTDGKELVSTKKDWNPIVGELKWKGQNLIKLQSQAYMLNLFQ